MFVSNETKANYRRKFGPPTSKRISYQSAIRELCSGARVPIAFSVGIPESLSGRAIDLVRFERFTTNRYSKLHRSLAVTDVRKS